MAKQEPKKTKRPDTPLATSPDPGKGGGLIEMMKQERAKRIANKSSEELKKKSALEEGRRIIVSDSAKNI